MLPSPTTAVAEEDRHDPDGTMPFDELVWRNRFAALPTAFYTRLDPTPLPEPYLVATSTRGCALLGIDPHALGEPASIAVLAGNRIARGSKPLCSGWP